MIQLKSPEEIELCALAADLVSRTLGILAPRVVPGVSPLELDRLAEEFIRDSGGIPAFKGLYGFPNTLCISPNDQVVHGIPGKAPNSTQAAALAQTECARARKTRSVDPLIMCR